MTLIRNGRAPAKVHLPGRCAPPQRRPLAVGGSGTMRRFAPPGAGRWRADGAQLVICGNCPLCLISLLLRDAETGNRDWSSGRSCARVAERQTRWLQVPVSERAWGFKSPLAHAIGRAPVFGPGLFCVSEPLHAEGPLPQVPAGWTSPPAVAGGVVHSRGSFGPAEYRRRHLARVHRAGLGRA